MRIGKREAKRTSNGAVLTNAGLEQRNGTVDASRAGLAVAWVFGLALLTTSCFEDRVYPVESRSPEVETAAPSETFTKRGSNPNLAVATDPNLEAGTLDNGLTYYVLRLPEQRRETAVWLGVNAGAVNETETQLGYAHFVEHMAFNGTKHFPGHAMWQFMQRAGMSMGNDINAVTSPDTTQFQFMVPSDNPTLFAGALQAVRDIAGNVTFDPTEVTRESAVIREELRLKPGYGESVLGPEYRALVHGTVYADRPVIGTAKSIERATSASLKGFYDAWYRPERMAVVIVGDERLGNVVTQIRKLFADIPDAGGKIPSSTRATDVEISERAFVSESNAAAQASLRMFAVDPRPRHGARVESKSIHVANMCDMLLQQRLTDVSETEGSPIVKATVTSVRVNRDLDALKLEVELKRRHTVAGLRRTVRELERVRRHGYLDSELLATAQRYYITRMRSGVRWAHAAPEARARELLRNFFEGEPVTGPAAEEREVATMFEQLRASDLEPCQLRHLDMSIVSMTVPSWEQAQTPADVRSAIEQEHAAEASLVRPWRAQDSALTKFREYATPKTPPGRIVATEVDAVTGADVWTLSNGVRVITKPTLLERETVHIEVRQNVGLHELVDIDPVDARAAARIVPNAELRLPNRVRLNSVLDAERSEIRLGVDAHSNWLWMTTHQRALDVALEAIHLRLSTRTFNEGTRLAQSVLKQVFAASNPEAKMRQAIARVSAVRDPLLAPLAEEDVAKLNAEAMGSAWEQWYSNADGLTVTVVGEFDPVTLRPLVETYLGSLPSRPRRTPLTTAAPAPAATRSASEVVTANTPRGNLWLSFDAPASANESTRHDALIVETLLELRLFEILREELGQVYTVHVSASPHRESPVLELRVSLSAAPDNIPELKKHIFAQLTALANVGPTSDELLRAGETVKRRLEQSKYENAALSEWLVDHHFYGRDTSKRWDAAAVTERLTSTNVKNLAATLLAGGDYREVVMNPDRVTD